MGGWDGTGLPHRPDWTYEVMSSSPGPLSPRLLATLAVVLVNGTDEPLPTWSAHSKIMSKRYSRTDGDKCQGED